MRPVLLVVSATLLSACTYAHQPAVMPGAPVASSEKVVHLEGSFRAKDGTPLFEQSWRPSADPKAVVVIVHGLKDHSDRYGVLAEELVGRGYAVHAFDLRGHGRSAGDRVWVRRFDDYLDDLGVFLAQVEKDEPGKKVFLFGHSMGGAIATLYVIDRHPDLAGMILSGPALKVTGDVNAVKRGATRLLGTLFPRLAVFSLPDRSFSRDPTVVSDLKKDPLVFHHAAPARTARELLSAIRRIQARMEAVEIPVLALHGAQDLLTNPEGSKELVARAASRDKRAEIVDGAWHDLLHEPEQASIRKTVGDWLDAHLP